MKKFTLLIQAFIVLTASSLCHALEWPELTHPDGAKVSALSDQMVMNGLPMQVFSIQFDESLEKTVIYYLNQLKKLRRDTHVAKTQGYDGSIYLSQVVGNYLISLRFAEQTSNSCTGQFSISDYTHFKDWQRTPLEFQMPDGSQILTDIETVDSGRKGRVVAYNNNLDMNNNRKMIIDSLMSRKFILDPYATIRRKNSEILFLFGPKRDAKVTLAKNPRGTAVEVVTMDNDE